MVWPEAKNKYAINADEVEERVVEELFKIIQDDEAFKTAIHQGNNRKGMVEELKEKKAFLEKEIKRSLVKRSKFQEAIGDYEGDDIKVFFASIRDKIKENEERIKESQDRIKALDEQIAKIPTDEEIRATHEQIKKYAEGILGEKGAIKEKGQRALRIFRLFRISFFPIAFPGKKKIYAVDPWGIR